MLVPFPVSSSSVNMLLDTWDGSYTILIGSRGECGAILGCYSPHLVSRPWLTTDDSILVACKKEWLAEMCNLNRTNGLQNLLPE